MTQPSYNFATTIHGISFDEVVRRTVEALKAEGFGVLTEIDVKETLKKKLDIDFRRYLILGACNPPLAHRALEAEDQIGLLLPCNVVVQDGAEGGQTVVSIAAPTAMFTLVDNPAVASVAEEAEKRLRRVISALGASE